MAASEWVAVKLEVRDKAKFIADMRASGLATRGLGNEVNRTSGLFKQGTHHGFLWNQALFTARRTVYGLTIGLGALAAGIVAVGFSYNSMLEQQSLAFAHFLGSVSAATDEVKFLFDLAAHGPFQFQQVLQGARQLMAFGMTVKDTNDLLINLQDAMAAMGLDPAAIDRATLALGQIQSSGRLLGQDLRQLEQLGLVNPQDLAARLGINPAQIGNIGKLNIPSKVAIDAISAYWKQRFGGAAADFQKTWVGEISTLKDLGSRLFGTMMSPLQHYLETKTIPAMTHLVDLAQSGFDNGGGFTGALGAIDSEKGTHLVSIFQKLVTFGKNLWIVIKTLAGSFWGAWQAMHATLLVLAPLFAFVWLLANTIPHFSGALQVLFFYLIATKFATLAVASATKVMLLWDGLALAATSRMIFATKLLALWRGRQALGTLLSIGALKNWAFAVRGAGKSAVLMSDGMYVNNGLMAKMTRGLLGLGPVLTKATAASWAFTASLLADPITWIVIGILALTVGLVILYYKWRWFHNLVDDTFKWIRSNWRIILYIAAPLLGPLGLAIALIVRLWSKVRAFYGWLKNNNPLHKVTSGHFWGNVGKDALAGVTFGASTLLPGLATGGSTTSHGSVMVGEAGPELLTLPRGATVSPLNTSSAHVGALSGQGGRGKLVLQIPVILDKKQIAMATAEYNLDELAAA